MPQPTSPLWTVGHIVARPDGAQATYNDIEVRIAVEAGIWLEWLPGDNKWIQLPVPVTDTPRERYFKVADIQDRLVTTFQCFQGQYMKIFKATYDENADPTSLRPTVDFSPDRGWHDRNAPRPLSSVDRVSTGYYFICETGPFPQQFEYTVYCPVKKIMYQVPINASDQYVHALKRHFLNRSYNLNDIPLNAIPDDLLDKVRIANYQGSISKEDIYTFIQDPQQDTLPQDEQTWHSWTNELKLVWDNATQTSPYMWTAKIYMNGNLCDYLPTLNINGRSIYPKDYDDNKDDGNTNQGDGRGSSPSPTPKRSRITPSP